MSETIERVYEILRDRDALKRPNKIYFEKNGWEDKYPEARDNYWKAINDANKQIKDVLLEGIGWQNHPGKDELYDFVFREWHGSGYHDILYYLDEVSTLYETIERKVKNAQAS